MQTPSHVKFNTGAERSSEGNKMDYFLLDLEWLRAVDDASMPLLTSFDHAVIVTLIRDMYDALTNVEQGEDLSWHKRTLAGVAKMFRTIHDRPDDAHIYGWTFNSINRLTGLLNRGARQYSPNNWRKGIPMVRYFRGFMRHYMCFLMDIEHEYDLEKDEYILTDEGELIPCDHYSACLFNLNGMWYNLKALDDNVLTFEQVFEGMVETHDLSHTPSAYGGIEDDTLKELLKLLEIADDE